MNPSPQLFMETITAYQRTEILQAALELDVFSALARGNHTVPSLAAACQCSERGIRILCDYLVVTGFLLKENSAYNLTEESALYLDQASPAYLGSIRDFLASPQLRANFSDIEKAIRHGGFIGGSFLDPKSSIWTTFARAMGRIQALPASQLAASLDLHPSGPFKVLDVAAGHGIYGLTLAHKISTVQITALDGSDVLQVAYENAEALGVSDRFSSIKGNIFEVDLGSGYHLILIPGFLHLFSKEDCQRILDKAAAALEPHGHLVIVGYIPDEHRISPATAFSITMLASTPSGEAHSFQDYKQMCLNAGLQDMKHISLEPATETAVIARKPC